MSSIKLSSEDGVHNVWACGRCGTVTNSEEYAERHCICDRCRQSPKMRSYSVCEACKRATDNERELRQLQVFMELPVVEDWDGPVYDDESGEFYPDVDSLIEVLQCDGLEDDEIRRRRVNTCNVEQVATPDLHDCVNDAWSEDGPEDHEMDAETKAILDAIHEIVAERAPTVWGPRRERLNMAAALPEAVDA